MKLRHFKMTRKLYCAILCYEFFYCMTIFLPHVLVCLSTLLSTSVTGYFSLIRTMWSFSQKWAAFESLFSLGLFQILDFCNIFIFVIQMTKNILILEGDHMTIKKIYYFFYKRDKNGFVQNKI